MNGMGNNESAINPYTAPSLPLQQHQVVGTTMSESGNISVEPCASKENSENAAAAAELIINSGGVSGFVEVSPTDTLLHVRSLIMDEFDEDMIPDEGDFYFCVNGIRLSAKQEARKLAMDLLNGDGNPTVSIHSKRKKQKISEEIETLEEAVKKQDPSVEEASAAASMAANDEAMDTGADEETEPTTDVVEKSGTNKDIQSKENLAMEDTAETASQTDSTETEESPTFATFASTSDGTDTQPPTAESTANVATTDGTEIESARRLLNFGGTFPFGRHHREGEEESVSTEDFTGTEITRAEPKEAPVKENFPAMMEGNTGSLKDDSGAETEKENVAPETEKESTSDVVMMNNQDDDEEEEEEDDDIVQLEQTQDPHKIHDQALKKQLYRVE